MTSVALSAPDDVRCEEFTGRGVLPAAAPHESEAGRRRKASLLQQQQDQAELDDVFANEGGGLEWNEEDLSAGRGPGEMKSLEALIDLIQRGDVRASSSGEDDLPQEVAALFDNPLTVELMTLFVNTVQEKGKLERSCNTMRQSMTTLQANYAESLETIKEETEEAEQQREKSSRIAAQVREQLLETKDTMDRDLTAKEEELNGMAQKYDQLQKSFSDVSRRLREQQRLHNEERDRLASDLQARESVIQELQQPRRLARRKTQSVLTKHLSGIVKEKEDEVTELREEINALQRQIIDKKDDETVLESDDEPTSGTPSVKSLSRRSSLLSIYFPSFASQRTSSSLLLIPAATPLDTLTGDGDEEVDLGELQKLMDEQIATSRKIQRQLSKPRMSVPVAREDAGEVDGQKQSNGRTSPDETDGPENPAVGRPDQPQSHSQDNGQAVLCPVELPAVTDDKEAHCPPDEAGANLAEAPLAVTRSPLQVPLEVPGDRVEEEQPTRMAPIGSEHPPARQEKCSFNVVMLGNSGVGKTSFCHRLQTSRFHETLAPTVGIDFVLREIFIDDKRVTLKLWDTAGAEKYRSLAPSTIRRADGVVVMYDVACETSFKAVNQWIGEVQEVTKEQCPIVIVCNKVDLVGKGESEEVPLEKAKIAMEQVEHCGFLTISCKSGQNVEDVLTTLTRAMIKQEATGAKLQAVSVKKADSRCAC